MEGETEVRESFLGELFPLNYLEREEEVTDNTPKKLDETPRSCVEGETKVLRVFPLRTAPSELTEEGGRSHRQHTKET